MEWCKAFLVTSNIKDLTLRISTLLVFLIISRYNWTVNDIYHVLPSLAHVHSRDIPIKDSNLQSFFYISSPIKTSGICRELTLPTGFELKTLNGTSQLFGNFVCPIWKINILSFKDKRVSFKINGLMVSAAVKTQHDSVLWLIATLVLLVRRTVGDREVEQGTEVFVSNILTAFNHAKR